MFPSTFAALGTLAPAPLPSADAIVATMGSPLLEAIVVAVAALACGIVVRLLVHARTPSITLHVAKRPHVRRAA